MYDYPRMRFVTANYQNLQGLRSAPVALFLTALGALQLLAPHARNQLPWLLGGFLLVAALYLAIGVYYRRTFGAVQTTQGPRGRTALGYALLFGVLLAGLAVDILWHPPVFVGGFAAALIFVAYWGRHRAFLPHYLVVGLLLGLFSLAPLAALLATGKVLVTLEPPYLSWFNIVFGAAWLALCVFDHLLLLRSAAPAALESQDARV